MEFGNYQEIEIFVNALDSLSIKLNEKQIQQFVDYYEFLVEKNKVMNLTAITNFKEVIQKHFVDSLSLVKFHDITKARIIDVGTGAGFPGIPLKIVFPDAQIVLLDSLNKRVQFLNEVIQRLELNQITAVHGRAEDFGRKKEYREAFDICVSRAVAKLSSLAEYCLPFVSVEGYFIPYKSGQVDEEIKNAKHACNLLGAEVTKVEDFILPDTDIQRTLVMIKKVSNTPKKYPRSAGKPTKEPL